MSRTPRIALLALLALTSTAACRRNRPAPVVQPAPATDDAAAERARREAAEREVEARRRAGEEEARLRAEREAAERARAAARSTLETTIYFAYDRSDLEAEARELLEAKLPILQANPGIRIRIAGHTDERGSDEYNLALGQRRAAAAKRYFTERGVEASRIEIVSFGEERPTCSASEESCWSRNRRDDFTITVGTVAAAPRP